LIDPAAFVRSIIDDFAAVGGLLAALIIGKWVAAEAMGRIFTYAADARRTVWSLTLPQVAATLAATLVASHTHNAAGERLLDGRMLNAVLVLVLTTSVLGPLLTQRYAPRMVNSEQRDADSRSTAPV
jgi:Na+:H+ antiporter